MNNFQVSALGIAGIFGALALGGCGAREAGIATVGATPASAATPEGDATREGSATPDLQATGANSSATPGSRIVRRDGVPNGVLTPSGLTVPTGFQVNVFADGLTAPRRLAIAPKGTPQKYDVFVAESQANRVRVLRSSGSGKADASFIFSDQLDQPYGLAFHPAGYLYIGNTSAVVRLPYASGATSSAAAPQKIADLTRGGYNQHWTRNLLFSRDAKRLYVTVGSSCNTCEEDDPQRAAISVMNPDGSARRVYASGMRNPVGLAWRPGTSELWTVVNERDNLGDEVPPDYLTRVEAASFHGWPYAYTDINGVVTPDPSFGDKRPDKVRTTVPPSVPVQAHSAALGVAFYPTSRSMFPVEYRGDAFLAFHGSWNRSKKTGYKIVRVHFRGSTPVSVTDFATGFLHDDGSVSGRPVDVTIAPDGALLFSDDGAGKIWRVSYRGAR